MSNEKRPMGYKRDPGGFLTCISVDQGCLMRGNKCTVPWKHTHIKRDGNRIVSDCPVCGQPTVFISRAGWCDTCLHADDVVYCETCDLEKTGKAFVRMVSDAR